MPFLSETSLDEELAPLASYPCPKVDIPVTDVTAWKSYPRYRWVYLKPLICDTQGISHGIDAVPPDKFPVFVRPITNLAGYGLKGRKIASRFDFEHHKEPGTFWMPYLEGEHCSIDMIWKEDHVEWHSSAVGEKRDDVCFHHWTVRPWHPRIRDASSWASKHLKGYSGQVNVEFIGSAVIEVHLRLGFQFLDFWGDGFLDALVNFYRTGTFGDPGEPKQGISIPRWDDELSQHAFESRIIPVNEPIEIG